jgi:transposase-like protein
MSKCTIKGCANEAVARGLCAKHYMRQRRRGDPEAAFPPGRQPKPRPEAAEAAALKREVVTLREEVAALKRQLANAHRTSTWRCSGQVGHRANWRTR